MSTLVAPAPPITAQPPGVIDTIVVMTAQAASTQTAALVPPTLTPTLTPLPTRTPSTTPSPSPTFIFVLSTLTRTPKTPTLEVGGNNGELSCSLSDQSPKDGAVMSKNQSFSVTWTVENTGTRTWDANGIDFAYASGTKLSSSKLLDLPKSVAPGESVKLTVNMVAPGSADTYKTVWTLESGKNNFCRLDISIKVK